MITKKHGVEAVLFSFKRGAPNRIHQTGTLFYRHLAFAMFNKFLYAAMHFL